MAHHTLKSAYQQLEDRLNRFPQGAPPSEYLYPILQILLSDYVDLKRRKYKNFCGICWLIDFKANSKKPNR